MGALRDATSSGELATEAPPVRDRAPAADDGRASATVVAPNGGIAAALLAAALACAAFGVLVVMAEASEGAGEALTITEGAGPLSGKGLAATAVWLIAWPALHLALRRRELPWAPTRRIVAVLVAVGLLGTFPPVYQFLAERLSGTPS
jgi:hypothetical protein